MKIEIIGDAKEIAALVLAVQSGNLIQFPRSTSNLGQRSVKTTCEPCWARCWSERILYGLHFFNTSLGGIFAVQSIHCPQICA